jgi:hypothetical protein
VSRLTRRTGGRRDSRDVEQPARDEEQQPRVEGVDQHIAQVIAPWGHATEGVVEPEGEPRERDVVAHPGGGDHPPKLGRAEAAIARVPQEVPVVVPVEECAVQGGQERQEGEHGDEERQRAQQKAPHRLSSVA